MFKFKMFAKTTTVSNTQLAASVAIKISVLLRGGMNLNRAVNHMCEQNGTIAELALRVKQRQSEGNNLAEAFAAENEPCWRAFASNIEVARRSGAPIAHACEKLSEAFLKVDSLNKKREVLLAGPKGTVVLISLLPILAIILASLMGVDMLSQLLNPRGLLLLLLGLTLLILGVLWSVIMIKSVAKEDTVAGIELDLLWVALAGGQTPQRALLLVADCADAMRAEWIPLNSFTKNSTAIRVIETAKTTGSPVRPLLAAEAVNVRETKHANLAKKAETLAIKILIPLGLLILPSFIVLGVIPMVIALMT